VSHQPTRSSSSTPPDCAWPVSHVIFYHFWFCSTNRRCLFRDTFGRRCQSQITLVKVVNDILYFVFKFYIILFLCKLCAVDAIMLSVRPVVCAIVRMPHANMDSSAGLASPLHTCSGGGIIWSHTFELSIVNVNFFWKSAVIFIGYNLFLFWRNTRGGATVLKVGGQFCERSEQKFFFDPPLFGQWWGQNIA